MARLTRQIGINPVQINLPQTTSVGPALIKTAQGIASREFDKAADKRTQEAQVAAAAINLVATYFPGFFLEVVSPSKWRWLRFQSH